LEGAGVVRVDGGGLSEIRRAGDAAIAATLRRVRAVDPDNAAAALQGVLGWALYEPLAH
jgi:hypothetical protein